MCRTGHVILKSLNSKAAKTSWRSSLTIHFLGGQEELARISTLAAPDTTGVQLSKSKSELFSPNRPYNVVAEKARHRLSFDENATYNPDRLSKYVDGYMKEDVAANEDQSPDHPSYPNTNTAWELQGCGG